MLQKKESKGTRDKAQGRNKEQGTRKIQDSRHKTEDNKKEIQYSRINPGEFERIRFNYFSRIKT